MDVTRRRVSDSRPRQRSRFRFRIALASTVAITLGGGGFAFADTDIFGSRTVGSESGDGMMVSDNQVIKPVGQRILTEYGKLMSSSVSPNGRYLAASATDRSIVLQIFDLQSHRLIYRVGTASGANQKLSDGTVGQDGPTYSPDGKWLWLSQADALTRFPVNEDGTLGPAQRFTLPKVGTQRPLPAQTAFSPDGSTLYVAVNGQNTVVAVDPASGAVKNTWKVGIAPRQLRFVGDKLYVSDEGGQNPRAGDGTMNSYGTQVPADTYKGTSTSGTVSVIDPAVPGAAVKTIDVGLHPTALHAAGRALFVTNTNSDTVSVIDTTKDEVVQTIDTQPYKGSKVGYHPNAVTLSDDGRLLVTLGRANAVAVFRYSGNPQDPVRYIGLLPTDYYPAEVAMAGGEVVVTNTRGIDARGPAITFKEGYGTQPATGHGTHSTTGSLTYFPLPSDKQIERYTSVVFRQNAWGNNDVKEAHGNRQAAVPVPKRLGDPSTIKHVFLLVKENRTYDQVYGDMARGNGDASLAQFGENVTPNQHALARQFGLYDNTYDIGTNSAEGHNWLMQGDNPEYTESSAGEYIRSYDTEDDVLGHQRSGFLWTSIEDAGHSARNFGEFTQFLTKPPGATWQRYYCAAKEAQRTNDQGITDPSVRSDTESPIPSLNRITVHDYPKFDTNIPDIYRTQIWKRDFKQNGPSDLNMFWLSSDHTGGPPSPRAQVADGDLAVGQIVDQISHSKYWKDSAIFVVEDDSQNGADHVDGHRAPIQIISPWARHGAVISRYYTQINLIRTIQQIMGAQPLNQKLAAATPMYDAFQRKPDFTPFNAVRNQVPLTEQVTPPPECGPDTMTDAPQALAGGPSGTATAASPSGARAAARLAPVPAAMRGLAAKWEQWRKAQHISTTPDTANPEQMNRYTWYVTHSYRRPYPGDRKFYAPEQVPGAYIPSADNE